MTKDKGSNETRLLTPTVWKNSIFAFLKIFITLIFCFFYILTILFYIYPKFNVDYFHFMGFKKAEQSSLIQVFNNSKKNEDLYNIIVFEQENKDYENQLKYIDILTSSNDYNAFCDKLDISAYKSIGNRKELIPFLCNTRSYISNQKVKDLWNLNLRVETFISKSLNSDYKFESSFYTYVALINNSNMALDLKREKIETLLNILEISNGEGIEVRDAIEKRIDFLNVKPANETEFEEIIRLSTLLNIAKGKKLTYDLINDINKSNEAKTLIIEVNSRINELFK